MKKTTFFYFSVFCTAFTCAFFIWSSKDIWLLMPKNFHYDFAPNAKTSSRQYRVLYTTEPFFLTSHPDSLHSNFSPCSYANCIISRNFSELIVSDAVIIVGRSIGRGVLQNPIPRATGQIWIFHSSESQAHYDLDGAAWRSHPTWRHGFNWSMTYDKQYTDVYLPYGEIVRKASIPIRNYTDIAVRKTKDALFVSSNCNNQAQRGKYVELLRKYITVDMFGACGKKWDCGLRYMHDNCFDIINTTYRFYLAFENSLCRSYFTEKVFENFNYDVITVTRGGLFGEAKKLFPRGSVISTDSFNSVDALGKYLSSLSSSVDTYASLLEVKDQYEAVPVKVTYQNALCQMCEMLNNQDKYRRHIPDTYNWTYSPNPCRKPTDLQ